MSKAIREEGNVAYVIGWIDLDQNPHSEYDKGNSNVESRNKEEHMPDNFTKTELEALLRANKAEVDVVAATVKKDMAEWREQQNTQMANLNATMQAMSSKIDGKLEGMQGKIDGVQGKVDGINTAISGIQSGISTRLTVFSVVIAVMLAIAGWWLSSKSTSSSLQPTTQSQQVEPAKK